VFKSEPALKRALAPALAWASITAPLSIEADGDSQAVLCTIDGNLAAGKALEIDA